MDVKALVAGGAGFLGSHLIDQLLVDGHEVTCMDNLYTGSLENLNPFKSNKRFDFIEADVSNKIEVTAGIDLIFNLACPASPVHYQRNPVETIKTSLFGSFNLLELALKKGAKILQASTSEVYGDPLVSPQVEEYWGNVNPIGIRACYDEGKRASETLFFDFHRQYNLDIKIARIFNTYGPRMDLNDGRVVSNFIVQALEGRDITIYGDGEQTRSFCYVDELVEGLLKLMFSSKDIKGPINLGNPVEFTMLELAQIIIELTGSKSVIRFEPLPDDDPKRRKPDVSKAQEKLNWFPTIDLREGLKRTVGDFQKRMNL
jgi:UDP-glucuronate decarboxylase